MQDAQEVAHNRRETTKAKAMAAPIQPSLPPLPPPADGPSQPASPIQGAAISSDGILKEPPEAVDHYQIHHGQTIQLCKHLDRFKMVD